MPNPEIIVVWGGNWVRSSRRIARPIISDIADISIEATSELGIVYQKPKTLRAVRVANSHELMGSAEGDLAFEVYFRDRDIKHRKLPALWLEFVLGGFHELLHAIRNEQHNTTSSLVELVATEALSHAGEDILAEMLGKAEEVELLSDYIDVNEVGTRRRRKEQLRRNDKEYTATGTNRDHQILDEWLPYEEVPVSSLGVMFGVTEVQAHLDTGVPFGELVQWPAAKILDLGEVAA